MMMLDDDEEKVTLDSLRIQTSEGAPRSEMIEQLRLGLYDRQRKSSFSRYATPHAAVLGASLGAIESAGETSPTFADSMKRNTKTLGTLWGVFIPCLQNILGVILFLRLTSITAQAGTFGTTGIICICAMSTFLTALSLSAVATNGRVAAGGPYFVISRNLGPQVGTAVGLLFYLGTTIAASMYVLGAVETLYDGFSDLFDGIHWEMRSVTTALVLMMFLAYIVLVGVKQVNALSSVFLAIVLFSVASSLIGICIFAITGSSGALDKDDRGSPRFRPKFRKDSDLGTTPDFQILIALFYPSVTGIMAGSNRSGVLKTPSKSIPTGTLAAIAVTTTLYVVFVWAFGTSINREFLYEEKLAVALVAWPSVTVVKIGIILSSVGAALQSLTGAPRLLYAIAQDGTVPLLSKLFPKQDDDSSSALNVNNTPISSRQTNADDVDEQPEKGQSRTKSLLKADSSEKGLTLSTSERRTDEENQRIQPSPSSVESERTTEAGEAGDVENPQATQPLTLPETMEDLKAENDEKNDEKATTGDGSNSKKKEASDVTSLAVGVTWFIASIPCLAGKLDAITPIVTMFFLLMYATVNLSCFFLAYLRSPGFRPTWKFFHWSSALLGFLWCITLMFYINVLYAVLAIILGSFTAVYVHKEGVSKDWGDASAGIRFQIARDQLLALTERSTFHHTKNWRPQILVMCKVDQRFNPKRPELLALAGCLKKGQGLLMAHSLLDAGTQGASAPRALVADAATEVLRLHLQDHHIQGFPRAVVYKDRQTSEDASVNDISLDVSSVVLGLDAETGKLARRPSQQQLEAAAAVDKKMRKGKVVYERRALFDAMLATVQSSGVGALRPNTVLLGWPRASARSLDIMKDSSQPASPSSRRAHRADFVQTLRDVSAMRKALIVLKGGESLATGNAIAESRTIDIWWVVQDGGLLLLLPWLLQRSKMFGNCRLRVFAVMTGLFAHHWNAAHGGAEDVMQNQGGGEKERLYLERFTAFVTKMLADVRIKAEVHPVAGLNFVWAAGHVYRDTLGLRGRTTYEQQLSKRVAERPASPIARAQQFYSSRTPPHNRTAGALPIDVVRYNSKLLTPRPRSFSADADAPKKTFDESITSLYDTQEDKLSPIRGFALALNRKMRRYSADAALVVTNLPYMTHLPPTFFVDYVDVMTEGLESVVLIRGSGMEVVTKYG